MYTCPTLCMHWLPLVAGCEGNTNDTTLHCTKQSTTQHTIDALKDGGREGIVIVIVIVIGMGRESEVGVELYRYIY